MDDALTASFAQVRPPGGCSVKLVRPGARFVLRGGADVANAAGRALGLNVPVEPCRATEVGECAALWLGPDEWLVCARNDEAEPTREALLSALQFLPHALVDVSSRDIEFEIDGPSAALWLSSGVPLELYPSAFPVGMCARTLMGKCGVLLWRRGPDLFRIAVVRSFAPYAAAFLAEAAFGLRGGAVSRLLAS